MQGKKKKDYTVDLNMAKALDENFSPLRDISHTRRVCGCDYAWLTGYNILTHSFLTHTHTHTTVEKAMRRAYSNYTRTHYRVLLETRTQLERVWWMQYSCWWGNADVSQTLLQIVFSLCKSSTLQQNSIDEKKLTYLFIIKSKMCNGNGN